MSKLNIIPLIPLTDEEIEKFEEEVREYESLREELERSFINA